MNFIKIKSRFANRYVFAGFVKRIGILHARILFNFYGLTGFQYYGFAINYKLLFSRNDIGVFFKLWRLKRLAPFWRRNHMSYGDFRIVGSCISVMFLN